MPRKSPFILSFLIRFHYWLSLPELVKVGSSLDFEYWDIFWSWETWALESSVPRYFMEPFISQVLPSSQSRRGTISGIDESWILFLVWPRSPSKKFLFFPSHVGMSTTIQSNRGFKQRQGRRWSSGNLAFL